MNSRRAFITETALGSAAFLLAHGARPAGASDRLEAKAAAAIPPDLVGSRLVVGLATREVWPGQPTRIWAYSEAAPGPTVRVRRGDVLALTVENRLPEATNVHWHGLIVPAATDGYPTDLISPGASRDYVFRVDAEPGTYWYHPHPDMRTAPQVYRGLAGLLIVEDEAPAAPLPRGEHDLPLVLQDRRRTRDGSLAYAPTPMDVMSGYLGDVALVNGVPDAELAVAAERYRLRLLNGSNARIFRLRFSDTRAFHVVASEGGLLERPVAVRSLDLAPGERAEIVIDFSADRVGERLSLVSAPFAGAGMPGFRGGLAQGSPLTLLAIRVARPGVPAAPLPATLAPFERLDAARATARRSFTLAMGMGMFGGFTINGRSFRADRVDTRVTRGDLELWEVTAASGEPHPFHAHGVRFQVLDRGGAAPLASDLGWKDTVLLWPGETVRLLVRIGEERGLFVMHCHNLEHEDAGMMANLEIV